MLAVLYNVISSFSVFPTHLLICLLTTNLASTNHPPFLLPQFLTRKCLFISATPTTIAKNDTHWNPINWWIEENQKGNYDTLHLYARDHLSCPAMATQCERVFSAARRTLTPEWNALGLKILEACECLKWWWRNGMMTGVVTGCPIVPRAQVEAHFITALLGDTALVEDDVE